MADSYADAQHNLEFGINFDTFPLLDSTEFDKRFPEFPLKFVAQILVEKHVKKVREEIINGEVFIPYYAKVAEANTLVDSPEKEKRLTDWINHSWEASAMVKQNINLLEFPDFIPSYMEDYGYPYDKMALINSHYLLFKAYRKLVESVRLDSQE
eukprot:CAMPEP_0184013724 /NCGR_PEP_ID=MMETSP0954-20121128/5185_1 /TAXON_ID=627963 /ORGANISM="Aplanochytrium sp, Strain PBS07" /LENGTH=153 /DNA_ID=CAMNT_0026293971 /DNA_START=254 /DNA_END=715 /DNA_ORIENTATION=-